MTDPPALIVILYSFFVNGNEGGYKNEKTTVWAVFLKFEIVGGSLTKRIMLLILSFL